MQFLCLAEKNRYIHSRRKYSEYKAMQREDGNKRISGMYKSTRSLKLPENRPAHFSDGRGSGRLRVAPRPCHHVSQPVSLKSPKPASWLIRAGIQPPRLHLTICRRATYSIISCPTWRVSLSLTQAESEVSLYLLHKAGRLRPG